MARPKKVLVEGEIDESSEDTNTAKPYYQEWDCKVVGKEAEKIKISRPCVKISDEEAETLNTGVLLGGNLYVKMYFKPE